MVVEVDDVAFDIALAESIVLEELVREGTRASSQFIDEHSEAPYIHPVVMKVGLIDHLRGQVVQGSAVGLSFVLAVIEVGPAEVCQLKFVVLVD